ncbi:MAG: hypothetical protein K8F25_09760 [Fimbriimonadaceae bacterium]|nr:hypothetical protein [Alphaproteobacteria bacterium]
MKPAPENPRDLIRCIVRDDWGRLLAALIALLGDFQLAEDSLQDALEAALVHWKRNGTPRVPAAWLMQVARRKAMDRLRREANFRAKQPDYAYLVELDAAATDEDDMHTIPDERLRLIFTCCHPALDEKTRTALTLRTLGGLTTNEIARAFLDSETAMAQRLVRAKRKIAAARIPYAVPQDDTWNDRLSSVLKVLYLIFNEGYSASQGDSAVRHDLTHEAIRLTRQIDRLKPDEPEIEGLLALVLLHAARSPARRDADGCPVALEDENRDRWNHAMIAEGLELVERALRRKQPEPFQIQAAISAVHAEATAFETTDWRQIVLLYDTLHRMTGDPVVALNRLAALSCAEGPQHALAGLQALQSRLSDYQPFHALHADLLARTGRVGEAAAAYERAIKMAGNDGDRAWLQGRVAKLTWPLP